MIPQTKEVSVLVGEWAEGVDNRSLLHEKFALPKVWGQGENKLNDAGRWSVLRIVTRGSDLLREDAKRLRREAGGRKVRPDVKERKEREAHVADKMASIARVDPSFSKLANENARRFLADVAKSFAAAVLTFEATLGSRLMINLAGGVVENAGIALNRCFGLPFIPGSAFKGITRVQALWETHEARGPQKLHLLRRAMILFGYGSHDLRRDFGWAGGTQAAQDVASELRAQELKGCACFLPAYPTTPPILVMDMVNPHYPGYYSGRLSRADDNESPIPNYFPAVEAGSAFGFAVLLNRVPTTAGVGTEDLLAQLKQWAEQGVTHKGVGAKTAAGYGWFELGRKEVASAQPQLGTQTATIVGSAAAAVPVSPVAQIVARYRALATKDNFPAALPEMAALGSNVELRQAFESLVPQSERNRLRKNHPYWQAFTSGKAGADGTKILARLGLKLS